MAMSIWDLSAEDRLRWLRDSREQIGDQRVYEKRQWIRDPNYYTARVAQEGRGASAEARTVFWVRIYGVFGEIYEYETALLKSIGGDLADFVAAEAARDVTDGRVPALLVVEHLDVIE